MIRYLLLSFAIMVFTKDAEAQENSKMIAECDKIIERFPGSDQGKNRVSELYKCVQLLTLESAQIKARLEKLSAPEVSSLPIFRKPKTYGPGWSTAQPVAGYSYENFTFAKTADGFVHLAGQMSGCPSKAIPIFTLPEGFLPKSTQLLSSYSGGSYMAMVLIQPDGRLFFWHSERSRHKPDIECNTIRPNRPELAYMGIVKNI